jgi:hypothetical protein
MIHLEATLLPSSMRLVWSRRLRVPPLNGRMATYPSGKAPFGVMAACRVRRHLYNMRGAEKAQLGAIAAVRAPA